MKGIKKLLSYVTKVEYAIMIVAFVAMVTAYFVAVVNRNFIKASMPWTEEVAMYSMIYMALLGTEVGLRDGTQVAVTAIIEKLHGITKKVVSIVEDRIRDFYRCYVKGWHRLIFKTDPDWPDNSSIKDPYVCHVFLTSTYLWTDLTDPDCDPRRKDHGFKE